MRKDVKLGLAVGGVLLAVLIVYVLVVPGSAQPGAELATAESGVESTTDSVNGGSATGAPQPAETPTASGTSSNDTQQQANGSAPANPGESAAQGDAVASNNTGGGFDWDKLLNGEGAPDLPSMNAQTPVPMTNPPGPALQPPVVPEPSATIPQPNAPAPISPGPAGPSVTPDNAVAQGGAAPGAPTTPAAPARIHVVQPNETFSSIAAAAYGSPNFYPHIQRANPSVDPSRLKPGMKISLPDVSAVKPAAETAARTEPAIDPNSQYRVQPNDNLHVISIKLYGNAGRATKIYELNKETIGDNPEKVKPGMVLKLPETPTVTASR